MNKEELIEHCKKQVKMCQKLNDYKHLSEHQAVLDLLEENQKLKKQLEYLRSGEYYNQLRFERDMLQNVVDKKEISKEDKEFIDMTQRNTELLEENQELKKQLTTYQILHRDCKVDNLKNISKIEEMENQQKEFISYLENEIYSIEPKGTGINYNCEYDSEEDYIKAMEEQSKLNTFKEILSKYRSIIGCDKSE